MDYALVFCYILMPKKNNCHQESSLQIRNTDIHDEIYDADFLLYVMHWNFSALQL